MVRKIIAGALLVFSSIFLGLSIAAIIMMWVYVKPVTQVCVGVLQSLDTELVQVQTALQGAKGQLNLALQIVDSTEQAINGLNLSNGAGQQGFPDLATSQEKINQAKSTLLSFRTTLEQINSFPFLSIDPGTKKTVEDLLASMAGLDTQISQLGGLIQKASTFINDSSGLFGGNFSKTKQNLQDFLVTLSTYDQKLSDWHAQVSMLLSALPGWIEAVALVLTFFLAWFGLSQLGLILHGFKMWRGSRALPAQPLPESTDEYEI